MKTTALSVRAEDKNWLKFLAVWSLGTGVVVASLIVAILSLVLPASQPNPLGETYFELIAAGRAPILYRLTIMFDILAWVGWGGLFITFAALLHRTIPLRSTLIALLSTGMSIGFIGACLRIVGTPEYASQYLTAAPTQQGAIIQSYDSLLHIINVTFSAGGLLVGAALLLISSATKYLPKVLSWPIKIMGAAGLIHLAKAVVELATNMDLGPLALLANLLLITALIAISIKLRALS
jgi:hypothetical protein